jgi:hypothetical protein
MIAYIHGPTLTTGTRLSSQVKWVRIADHYVPEKLDELLLQSECSPDVVVFQDFFWFPIESKFKTIFAPVWLGNFCKFAYSNKPLLSNTMVTNDCFNFVVYKPRPLREQAIEVVLSHNLKTQSYVSTSDYLESKNLPLRWFGNRYQKSAYDNVKDYNLFLRDNVFNFSAVALITETIEHSWVNNTTFTEKSIWPMLSLNFPIWLGGYQQADLWESIGFDVFRDCIDHSYQHEVDPTSRIKRAISDNIKVLSNLEIATNLRNHHRQRLLNNRQLVLQNQVMQFCKSKLLAIDLDSLLPTLLAELNNNY